MKKKVGKEGRKKKRAGRKEINKGKKMAGREDNVRELLYHTLSWIVEQILSTPAVSSNMLQCIRV